MTEKKRNLLQTSHTEEGSDVAILIPCLNEELTIGKVVRDFQSLLPKASLFVFDNNSTDQTAQKAHEAGARVIASPIPGKGSVIKHMFSSIHAPYYILVDGDDTYPVSAAPQLLNLVRQQKCDMAVGSRMSQFEKGSFRPFHQFGNHLVAKLVRFCFPSRVTDIMSGYRAFSGELVKTLPLQSQGFEIETELTLQALSKGYSICEIPIEYGTRPKGSLSKLNTLRDGTRVLKSLFLIAKDYRPFLFFSLWASLFGILSLMAGSTPILDYLRFAYVHHIPLALLSVAFGILSALFFSIGLILDSTLKYHQEQAELLRRILAQNLNIPPENPETGA